MAGIQRACPMSWYKFTLQDYNFRMSNVIHKENRYRIYTKGNEKRIKHFSIKSKQTQKKTVIQKMRGKKAIMHTENKYQNDRNLFLISKCFKCEWVNFPIKRQRSAKWIFSKSMIQLYFVYYRLILDPKTQIVQSERIEKDILCKQ